MTDSDYKTVWEYVADLFRVAGVLAAAGVALYVYGTPVTGIEMASAAGEVIFTGAVMLGIGAFTAGVVLS